tara:strand:+ start:842 stop:1456 length:615 start_codon:yes stop_codon:yes gene_type:complete
MAKYTIQQIQKTVESKGYKWFTGNKGYDVNIVGVRNSETHGEVTNKFDDTMTLSYKDLNGKWHFHCFDCTTDPGSYWVENVMNKNGVAILKPGQYRGSHRIGLHQGKYEALTQAKPLKVYRDNNRDDKYDLIESNVHEGIYGINIHRATKWEGKKSTQIDKWSAGCQVIAANDDFRLFMEIIKKGAGIWGNSFSYTLIESKDIV